MSKNLLFIEFLSYIFYNTIIAEWIDIYSGKEPRRTSLWAPSLQPLASSPNSGLLLLCSSLKKKKNIKEWYNRINIHKLLLNYLYLLTIQFFQRPSTMVQFEDCVDSPLFEWIRHWCHLSLSASMRKLFYCKNSLRVEELCVNYFDEHSLRAEELCITAGYVLWYNSNLIITKVNIVLIEWNE